MTTEAIERPTLAERLRSETDSAHRSLEAAIGFDLHSPSVDRALGMLRGFYSVLRDLEPAMLTLAPAALADRGKLALLRSDLRQLGMTADEIDRLASPADVWKPRTSADAFGALYVMEGSTLGGKVIVKALRRLPDWPLGEPCYFDPYGTETGMRWNAFKEYLNKVAVFDGDAVVDSALQTFALLEHWMVLENKA